MVMVDNIIYCDFIDFYYNNQMNISREIIKTKYLRLMGNLTNASVISDELFENNLNKINTMGKIIVGYVVECNYSNNIEFVGSGTIIIEPKIIRNGMSVAHMEDIVVSPLWRGNKISSIIIHQLKTIAISSNCYKIILDCDPSLEGLYASNHFNVTGIQMGEYFL